MNVLHISDLHFGPRHWEENDKILLKKINSFDMDIVFNTDDNTTDGLEDEYAKAGRFLKIIVSNFFFWRGGVKRILILGIYTLKEETFIRHLYLRNLYKYIEIFYLIANSIYWCMIHFSIEVRAHPTCQVFSGSLSSLTSLFLLHRALPLKFMLIT